MSCPGGIAANTAVDITAAIPAPARPSRRVRAASVRGDTAALHEAAAQRRSALDIPACDEPVDHARIELLSEFLAENVKCVLVCVLPDP